MIAWAGRAGTSHLSKTTSPATPSSTLQHVCSGNANGHHSLPLSVKPAASTPPPTTLLSKYSDHQPSKLLSLSLTSSFSFPFSSSFSLREEILSKRENDDVSIFSRNEANKRQSNLECVTDGRDLNMCISLSFGSQRT